MKENREIERILLNESTYGEFVKNKTEKDFVNEITISDNKRQTEITDFKLVPKDKLFSKDALFFVINKKSKTKSYINGLQAEGFLGGNNFARNKLLSGESDSFVAEDYFVKFKKIKV